MDDVDDWLFSVEDVDRAVFSKLKWGKTPGCDGLSPEHLVYSHPSLIIQLKLLFNTMLKHGYVPDIFGIGIIVPLIKDRHGDIRNSENNRAITISSVISKVFEICLYDKMEQFLHTGELQYGFKPGYGCNTAVFTLQHVANYFRTRQSNVYVSAIDASKAFDRINHQKLISKLIQRQLPTCFFEYVCQLVF